MLCSFMESSVFDPWIHTLKVVGIAIQEMKSVIDKTISRSLESEDDRI